MLNKVITIQNVGRFAQSASTPNPDFKKHSLVFAPNAYGKSTFCAVLRSWSSGEIDEIIGRSRLGAEDDPKVDLLFNGNRVTFVNGQWSEASPPVSVFDGTFVQKNVYSGDVVDISNRRALYRIIIGQEGVMLAERERELTENARAKQVEIRTVEKSLEVICDGMQLKAFLKLDQQDDINDLIAEQKTLVSSLKVADEINKYSALDGYSSIAIDEGLISTLNESLDSVGDHAENLLKEHFTKHNMGEDGQLWIDDGLAFIEQDACPFCGRDELEALPIIQAYRVLFSEAYESLKSRADNLVASYVEPVVGSDARTKISRRFERNVERVSFWKKHCAIKDEPNSVAEIIDKVRVLENRLKIVITRKLSAVSEPAVSGAEEAEIVALIESANAAIGKANQPIEAINALIEERKASVGATDLEAETLKLTNLERRKARFSREGIALCEQYNKFVAEKKTLEDQKKDVRKTLDAHTKTVIEPYENRINSLLSKFNAGFSIAKTDHSYTGGVATSSYQLRINNVEVQVGDVKTPGSKPSFKNTLSGGDKSTLALAFFLAHLEKEDRLDERVVVFDDPFNSQDAFRRTNTIFEILRIADTCAQAIVLSHDLNFLSQIWDKCPSDDRCSAQIDYHESSGSKIRLLDLENASQGRTARERDDLINFRTSGSGALRDIIKKMRVVCESHFRSAYPGVFESDDNCGAILRKIRDGGEEHPAQSKYTDLNEINSYTQDYHHGEDANGQAEPPLDKTELTGFVDKALTLVNANSG